MPVNSDAGGKLLAWLAVGSGSLLAYSAYKNRAPWDVLRDIEGAPLSTPTANSDPAGFGNFPTDAVDPTSFANSTVRVRAVMNREIPPDLVDIGNGFKLDRDAATSYLRVSKVLAQKLKASNISPAILPITDAYRSFSSQSASYNGNNPVLSDGRRRFGDPNKSAHVVGLAIDVRPEWVAPSKAALAADGWQNVRPNAEPWHWSYLIRG